MKPPKSPDAIKKEIAKKPQNIEYQEQPPFKYIISGCEFTAAEMEKINSDVLTIRERLSLILKTENTKISFSGIPSKKYRLDLQLIESKMPEILGNLLLLFYLDDLESNNNQKDKANDQKNKIDGQKDEINRHKNGINAQKHGENGPDEGKNNLNDKNKEIKEDMEESETNIYNSPRYSKKISELVLKLEHQNPCNYDLSFGQPFYQHKIKNFLAAAILGLFPNQNRQTNHNSEEEMGNEEKYGNKGENDGENKEKNKKVSKRELYELEYPQIYNWIEIKDYLFENTKLETPSQHKRQSTKQKKAGKLKEFLYGNLYKEGENYFINLNLQIRFCS